MRVIYYLKNKISTVHVLAITFLALTSCGTYQQATYDDGIYGSDQERAQTTEVVNTGNDPYQNYFEQKSFEAEDRYGDIFTDVDSYSSQGDVDPEVNVDNIGYTESYAAWGQNTEDININVYGGNNGWNNWGYAGWNNWGWNNWGYGLGWNNWGWNNWGWGNNPWNFNWGWNAGLCGPYGNAGFYGGGFYGQQWGNPYFRGRNGRYAYNQGRRTAYANRNAANRRGNYFSRTSNRNNTRYTNSRTSRRNTRGVRSTRNTRNSIRNTRNTRNTRATTRSTRNNQVRSTTTRSSNSRSRGSSMSTRSSSSRGSSMRSSGGGSRRSSGSSSRGGSRRGGRG